MSLSLWGVPRQPLTIGGFSPSSSRRMLAPALGTRGTSPPCAKTSGDEDPSQPPHSPGHRGCSRAAGSSRTCLDDFCVGWELRPKPNSARNRGRTQRNSKHFFFFFWQAFWGVFWFCLGLLGNFFRLTDVPGKSKGLRHISGSPSLTCFTLGDQFLSDSSLLGGFRNSFCPQSLPSYPQHCRAPEPGRSALRTPRPSVGPSRSVAEF